MDALATNYSSGKSWTDKSLIKAAVAALERRLPPRWRVEAVPSANDGTNLDIIVHSENGGSQTNLLVEVKRTVAPRDITELTGGLFGRVRGRVGRVPILLVAPYISPRSRDLLIANDINYLDLTGNVRISIDYPGLFIVTEGAQVDPTPVTRGTRGLRGAKVGAVVRVLIDARPPYTGAQLARAANVNEGYVSRILDALLDEGLITRPRSGPILDVDWQALLRQRASALTLFRKTGTFRYVARNGTQRLLDAVAQIEADERPVVTGSFAAVRLAPVAPPAQLVLYTRKPRELAARLPIVEVESGADTVLIRPDNDIALMRSNDVGGVRYAAASQVAIDCLSGSGRMPAEGEAVIEWMAADEDIWRLPSIDPLLEPAKSE